MTEPEARAAVIGWPIAHSRSPTIHRYWLAHYGLSGSYDAIAVPPDQAEQYFATFAESGLVGANVTIPHKLTAAGACRILTPTAEALGAVNTLWWENGALAGDNTDVHGFLANLDQEAPGWAEGRRSALVIGAGGAARAIVYGLLARGLRQVVIANRTRERADVLAAAFAPAVSADWTTLQGPLTDFSLIVNTTSLGMNGQDEVPIDVSAAADDTVVCDIVYVPLETGLLRQAGERGLRTVGGLGMLLHQAAPGFARWFGVTPEITGALREHVLADIVAST